MHCIWGFVRWSFARGESIISLQEKKSLKYVYMYVFVCVYI